MVSGGVICLLGWTFRISSGVSKRIYQSVVQGDRKFLRIGAGCWTLRIFGRYDRAIEVDDRGTGVLKCLG